MKKTRKNSKLASRLASKPSKPSKPSKSSKKSSRFSSSKSSKSSARAKRANPKTSGTPQSLLTAIKRRGLRTAVGVHACQEVIKVHPHLIDEAWIKKGWEHSKRLESFYEDLRRLGIVPTEKLPGFLDKVNSGHQGIVLHIDGEPSIDWSKVGRSHSHDYSNDHDHSNGGGSGDHDRSHSHDHSGDQTQKESGKYKDKDKERGQTQTQTQNQTQTQTPHQEVFLGLDGIEDSHNLGAILRTSWLLGVKGILIPSDQSAGLTPAVHKVACGGVEYVPVEEITRFSVPFDELKKRGFWIYGLSANASRSIWETDFSSHAVLVVGAEDKGLRSTTENQCDQLVSIPQISPDGSYNASVATAMVLSEVMRQQKLVSGLKIPKTQENL